MPEPALSVVVPTKNGRELLTWSLPALLTDLADLPDGVGAEVIVVDDHSDDGTAAWLASELPQVRIVELTVERGFAAACNAGAWVSRGPLIAFLNSDAEVQPGWAAALLATARDCPEAVVIGALAVYRDDPDFVNSAGVTVTTAAAASDIGLGQPLAEVDLSRRRVAGVSGVSMLVRADWFARTRGFDERLFMYFEDVELCLRAWLEGQAVVFEPAAVVRHQGGASSGARHQPLRSFYGTRNRVLIAAGCLDRWSALRALPVLVAQDLVACAVVAAGGRPRVALAGGRQRLRGLADGLRRFRTVRAEPWSPAARTRSFSELRALGIVEPWTGVVGEFVRLRRRELRSRPAGPDR
jgi:N-acetylglucosaminyl-diphospho-decaprenol L-rhamnosyltransferase